MKILLLNQAFYPDTVATAQHLTDLAVHLRAGGWEVTVVADSREYNRRARRYPLSETWQGIRILRVPSTGLGKRRAWHRAIDGVTFLLGLAARLVQVGRQDVVIALTSPPMLGLFGVAFCRVKGGKFVQWLMDLHPHAAVASGYLKPRSPLARLLYWAFRTTMRRSDHVVALDRWMREEAVRSGASPERVSVVPPWPLLREKPAAPAPAPSPFRERHGLQHRFLVCYSGNHSVVHPLDTLLDAAVKLREDRDVVFLFIGSGARVADVRRYVDRYGLTNVVQLENQPREALGETLAAADVHVVVMGENLTGFVHPSKIYGVLATGKPYVFIGPERSHVGDLLSQCPYGYHVRHGESDKLVETLRSLQEKSFEELLEYHRNNTEFVSREYSAQKLLRRFTEGALGGFEPRLSPQPSRTA